MTCYVSYVPIEGCLLDQDEKLVRSDEGVELMVELIGVGPEDTYWEVDGMDMVHARFNFLVQEFKKQGCP